MVLTLVLFWKSLNSANSDSDQKKVQRIDENNELKPKAHSFISLIRCTQFLNRIKRIKGLTGLKTPKYFDFFCKSLNSVNSVSDKNGHQKKLFGKCLGAFIL